MPELVESVVDQESLSRRRQPDFNVDELLLRPFQNADASQLVDVYRDPDIQRWHMRSMSEDDARQWILSAQQGWLGETSANWAVVNEEDRILGRVGFRTINLREGVAEIAYWTARPARGRNIAARAVDAVSVWMFTHIGMHRLELNHSTHNSASCRVATKAGYVYEGTRRRRTLHYDGWHDMHLHGRLTDDRPAGGGSRVDEWSVPTETSLDPHSRCQRDDFEIKTGRPVNDPVSVVGR